jgi:hypothetical protein
LAKIDAKSLVNGLERTLSAHDLDYQKVVDEFGQVRASDQRARGERFDLADHVRGLILSLLSNQRPWGPIAQNLDRIASIFFRYDPPAIKSASPSRLTQEIREIHCGNRQIEKQMKSLAGNVDTLERIDREYGSLDRFVESADPHVVATKLSSPKSDFKLRQVGYTLGMEYLRNVGIRATKPDVHVRRAIGLSRLALVNVEKPSEEDAYRALGKIASAADVNATYLDNLLWLFCAQDYGDVCGATPRCGACLLKEHCHYPKRAA